MIGRNGGVRIQRMHTWVLKKSVTRIARAAEPGQSERTAITDAGSAIEVLPVEGGPAKEAAVEAAKDDIRLPNRFISS